jgi:hypothetical protein
MILVLSCVSATPEIPFSGFDKVGQAPRDSGYGQIVQELHKAMDRAEGLLHSDFQNAGSTSSRDRLFK